MKHLSSAAALLVLDGVDHDDQVSKLLSFINDLHPNSLVVITSRCEHALLRSVGVPESSIYNVKSLDWQHSEELFCLYAFRQPSPLAGFEFLVEKFTKACDGLPLLLKVFGAFLYGNNRKLYWEDLLDELQELRDTHIKLNVLYDALSGEEQQIFLDVACFFIGEDRDSAIRIWNKSGWKGLLRFGNLENRCLLEVDNENKIRMQDCLRDMGRGLAKASEFPCRLCQVTPADIDEFMERSSVRTGVRGIKMLPVHKDYDGESASFSSCKSQLPDTLQLLDIDGHFSELIVPSTNLIWLRWIQCPYSSLPSRILLKNLRVLKVEGLVLKTLWQHESQAPFELQELWITAPLSEIPKSIGQLKHLERIHVINLMGNTLEELPEEFCHLQQLKELALLDCSEIKFLPDSFGNLTNLEHIDLSGSKSLQMLPDSFSNLIRLKYLDLNGCLNLRISYATIGDISSLEHLNLSACEKIKVLPVEVSQQRDLKKLYLCGTELKKLPSAIGDLSNLELLELGSPSLEMLPRSLGDLKRLKEFKLLDCPKLKRLPDSIRLLTRLTHMTVKDCNLRKIEGLCALENLEILDVRKCSELEELEGVEHCISLKRLYASGCPKLQMSGGARDQLRQRLKGTDMAF
jgi:Leucine-rich repeat (LRR) protein